MIHTARLLLRPPNATDAAALSNLMTPAISRRLGTWPAPLTIPMATERIEALLKANSAGVALNCLLEQNGHVTGYIGCHYPQGASRANFGYWLGEPHWRHGLMREAAPPFVEAAQKCLLFDALEAVAQPSNRGSFAVMAACGMTFVGSQTHWAASRQQHEDVDVWQRLWPPSR